MLKKQNSIEIKNEIEHKPKNRIAKIVAGSALTLALAAGFTGYAGTASAADIPGQTTSATRDALRQRFNPESAIVSKLAAKFNLNAADVQAVFDEARAEMKTQMETQMKAAEASRLSAAVTAGKLTQAQADIITAKRAELQAKLEANKPSAAAMASLKSMTAEQRKSEMEKMKAAMESEMTALKAWATANNIPAEFIPFAGGHMGMKGNKGMLGQPAMSR